MAIMKSFCGCMGTKSGSLLMIALYGLVYIGEIVALSIRLARGTEYGWFDDWIVKLDVCYPGRSVITSGEFADTLWCKMLTNIILVEFYFSLVKICVNALLLSVSAIAIFGAAMDKAALLLPYLVTEAIQMFIFLVSGVVTVVHLIVYRPDDIQIDTIVCVAVIWIFALVPITYLWICPVSLYQTLKEIQELDIDKAKIIKFQDNDPSYDQFGPDTGYDPHSDDYPVGQGEDEGEEGGQGAPPPSYRATSSPRPKEQEPKIEDLVE